MFRDNDISTAIGAVEQLMRDHQHLLEILPQKKQPERGGSFTKEGDKLRAEALGVQFRVEQRPVVVGEHISKLEYAFIAQHEGKDTCVMCLYLDGDGALYTDPSAPKILCDTDNSYLATKIVGELILALLRSPVLQPRSVMGKKVDKSA